jgi:hypothetical protein
MLYGSDGQMPLEGLTTLVSERMGWDERDVWWRRYLFRS